MTLQVAAALGVVLAVAAGWMADRRARDRRLAERIARFLLPLAILAASAVLVADLGERLANLWSYARLAPSAAWLHGRPIFSPADAGPVLGHIYGPVQALFYAPAVALTTPGGAVRVAWMMNLVLAVAGAVVPLTTLAGRSAPRGRVLAWAALFLLGVGQRLPSTNPQFLAIHADAPAIGLCALACACLCRRRDGPGPVFSTRQLAVSATLVVLAVWTKQPMVFAALALVAHVHLVAGRRGALRYVAWLSGASLVVGGAFLLAMDPADMWLNMVEIPSRHPLATRHLAERSSRLALQVIPLAGLFAWAATLPRRGDPGVAASGSRIRRAVVGLGPFGLVALVLLPISLAASLKVGGSLNSLFTIPFLLLAVVFAFGRVALQSSSPRARDTALLVFAAGATIAFCSSPRLTSTWLLQANRAAGRAPLAESIAYRFEQRRPGVAIFPWSPLAPLMASGRPDHFAYGLFDRELAGMTPTPAHVESVLPPGVRYLVYLPGQPAKAPANGLRYFAGFVHRVTDKDLPGCVIYSRTPPEP